MVRRRKDKSDLRAREREAFCSHRACTKVADEPRANPAVRDWFARVAQIVEGQCPSAFTNSARSQWVDRLKGEADTRNEEAAARGVKDGKAVPAPDAPPPPPPTTTATAALEEAEEGTMLAKAADCDGMHLEAGAEEDGAGEGQHMDAGEDDLSTEAEVRAATATAEATHPPSQTGDEQTNGTEPTTARENAPPGDK